MGLPGESTAAERAHELARLRALAEAAEAWARWRREQAGGPASDAESALLAALDRLAESGGHGGRRLLVLCSACRRTRDGTAWVELEDYLTQKAVVEFTHGVCPDCMERLYPPNADQ
jgi:hypothetical protein